jgi:dihydroorotate dehydrogenase (NAD+) catalytic subunit
MNSTAACIGKTKLKNPVICAAGEHVMSRAGIQKALQAGAAAVVAKSTNETSAARSQMTKADYLALDGCRNGPSGSES